MLHVSNPQIYQAISYPETSLANYSHADDSSVDKSWTDIATNKKSISQSWKKL